MGYDSGSKTLMPPPPLCNNIGWPCDYALLDDARKGMSLNFGSVFFYKRQGDEILKHSMRKS